MTVYLGAHRRTAIAALCPDSPDLPVGPTWWADRRDRVWVEAARPGYLHAVNEQTGYRRATLWPWPLVWRSYGPLMDVTPDLICIPPNTDERG